MNSWFLLFAAIAFEVMGTTSMKLSRGFTRLIPSISIFVCYGISFVFTTFALKRLDVSTVYAVWSGVGTALVALIGWLWFKEPLTALKIVSLGLIVLGVIGLNLSGGAG
jgi:small multidrug resistance pump